MNQPAPKHAESAPPDLGQIKAEFDRWLESYIQSRNLPANLHRAIVYSVLGGGKRLRPAMAWYASIACGGTGEGARWAGVAVELIHAFSLVHDDLPALDNDHLRRGRPTLHIHTSEAMAVLAGDAMLAMAHEAALEHPAAEVASRLVRELGIGTRAMIVGQVYDTLGGFPPGTDPEQRLGLIHRNKTGALLTAACRMGAICADADEEILDLITAYAGAIGLQFQIIDDLLDVEGASEQVGKALGKDQAAGKLTYPGVLGAEQSRAIVIELAGEAEEALDRLASCSRGSVEPLRMMGRSLTHRTF